jgi:hypothetical protein
MLAQHPITGKQIRIMKTEAQLYKNQKTMAWLRQGPSQYDFPGRFSRWYTLVQTHTLAEEWYTALGEYPSAIVLTEPSPETIQWLKMKAPTSKQLLFLSKSVISAFGKDLAKEKHVNIICLEELAEMYPHVFHNYTPSEEPSMTTLSIAALFRVQRLFGLTQTELQNPSINQYINQLHTAYKMKVDIIRTPEPLWLIQQFFESDKPKRNRELNKCLEENIKCPFIDTILLLNEEDFSDKNPQLKSNKIIQQVIGHRMTYADVFLTIKEKIPDSAIVVFANSDIYLDSTSWSEIWSVNLDNVFLSLLRYDEQQQGKEPVLYGPRPDSQDTWVLTAKSVKDRQWDYDALNFEFGKAGCDNAINVEMLKKKYLVANPALSLKTIHCHASNVRTYNQNDIVEKPIFLYLDPTGLHDLEPLGDLKPLEKTWDIPASFSRKVHSIDEKRLKTFCRLANLDSDDPNSENTFIPHKEERVYSIKNGFATTNGLVYGYDKIYLGKSQTMREAWAATNISHMTPCIGVNDILSAPLSDETCTNAWTFMLNYLSKIFRLRNAGFKGDMWLPRNMPKLQEFLQFFKWNQEVMPVLPRDEDIIGYGSNITLLEPRANTLVYKEEIEALRSNLRDYEEKPKYSNRIVIFQDEDVLSPNDTLTLETVLEKNGYEVNVIYPNRSSASFILQRTMGVSYCISTPKYESLYWLLPKDAHVIDIMPETRVNETAVHVAGAASLEYWVLLMPRLKGEAKCNFLVEQIMKTMMAIQRPTTTTLTTTINQKPTIIMPTGFEGYYSHVGDSFREMVSIWAEKGWITLKLSTETPHIWWGSIGNILLYDRPTLDWIKKAPAKYEKILCGNPDASQIEKGVQWSFWPRRPRLLENKELLPYDARTKTLVFYGRVENNIQKEHRTNELYKACDDFDMPIGAMQPYKYSQEEYLNKLAESKFGLCMAGYGPKCNREIECMALGTVPLVAPDVDMDKYYNPPKEGVHYIRLKSFDPDEALKLVGNTSQEAWKVLSDAAHQWWKENCSVEGLFTLTKTCLNI